MCAIFVDHFFDLAYDLLTKLDGEEAVRAKQVFDHLASSYDINIHRYHCDNGLFDTNIFKDSIQKSNQVIYFCGVNAHHQNSKAERQIRDNTEGTCTASLHNSHHCPKAIDDSLWLEDLKNYVNTRNNIPT